MIIGFAGSRAHRSFLTSSKLRGGDAVGLYPGGIIPVGTKYAVNIAAGGKGQGISCNALEKDPLRCVRSIFCFQIFTHRQTP